jgi:hypothetical protein
MSGVYTEGLTVVTALPSTSRFQVDLVRANGQSPQQGYILGTQLDSVAPSAITYAATITPDRSLGRVFTVTLTGNVTLANPTNLNPGESIDVVITQDGTGSRLLSAVGSLWKFPGGTKTLSTPAGSVDCIKGVYDGTRILANLSLAYA